MWWRATRAPAAKAACNWRAALKSATCSKLRDKYSAALNASFLDNNGKSQIMEMGCYGIGITRVVAAAIEQNNDEKRHHLDKSDGAV